VRSRIAAGSGLFDLQQKGLDHVNRVLQIGSVLWGPRWAALMSAKSSNRARNIWFQLLGPFPCSEYIVRRRSLLLYAINANSSYAQAWMRLDLLSSTTICTCVKGLSRL
jgi:hypothetical protein